MENNLPDINVFQYLDELDGFIETQAYQDISTRLGLREWNGVVWIGRLFSMDNDHGEHWFDNWELLEQKEGKIKEMGFAEESVYVLDPSRFQNGQDGPCHSPEFRKRFWTDVLKSFTLNLGTLIEKGRQVNEKKKDSRLLAEEYDPNYESRVEELLEAYVPDSLQLKLAAIARLGLTAEKVKEIVMEADAGMHCYVHKETQEVVIITEPYDEGCLDADDPWRMAIEHVEANPDQYWKIRKMGSHDAFVVMERFVDQLPDGQLKKRLSQALNRNKPFRNFRWEIDDAGDYRDEWFRFKRKEIEAYVIDRLVMYAREVS